MNHFFKLLILVFISLTSITAIAGAPPMAIENLIISYAASSPTPSKKPVEGGINYAIEALTSGTGATICQKIPGQTIIPSQQQISNQQYNGIGFSQVQPFCLYVQDIAPNVMEHTRYDTQVFYCPGKNGMYTITSQSQQTSSESMNGRSSMPIIGQHKPVIVPGCTQLTNIAMGALPL